MPALMLIMGSQGPQKCFCIGPQALAVGHLQHTKPSCIRTVSAPLLHSNPSSIPCPQPATVDAPCQASGTLCASRGAQGAVGAGWVCPEDALKAGWGIWLPVRRSCSPTAGRLSGICTHISASLGMLNERATRFTAHGCSAPQRTKLTGIHSLRCQVVGCQSAEGGKGHGTPMMQWKPSSGLPANAQFPSRNSQSALRAS